MSHLHAASALLLLSLPHGLAVPLAQGVPVALLPAFQLLSSAASGVAAPSPTGEVLALINPAGSSDVPTGGVLTSDELPAAGSPVPLPSPIGDPIFLGGPENELIDPVPDPIIPVPTPVSSGSVSLAPELIDVVSAAIDALPTPLDAVVSAALDAVPSPLESVVSEILTMLGTPVQLPGPLESDVLNVAVLSSTAPLVTALPRPAVMPILVNATILNSTAPLAPELSEPEVLPAPINATVLNSTAPLAPELPEPAVLLAPINATVLNSTAPLAPELPEPAVLPVPINATVLNATEPLVTDVVEPEVLPVPTDFLFIDPILSILPDGTVIEIADETPIPAETIIPHPIVDSIPPLSPPSKTLELATFTDLIQGIANIISSLFTILPPDAVAAITPPATEDTIISEPFVPDVDVPVAPFPLVNETTNGTIFKRQAPTIAGTSQLPVGTVLDLIGRILDLALGLVKAGPVLSNKIPPVSNVLGGASTIPLGGVPVKPLLSTLKLDSVLAGASKQTKRDLEDEPVDSAVVADILKSMLEIITSLFSQVTSAAPEPLVSALPVDVPAVLASVLSSALPVVVPTSLPVALPTTVPIALPTDLPTDLPTELPTDLPAEFQNLPTELPTDLPAEFQNMPTGLPTDLPLELPTTLPIDLPTELPTDLLVRELSKRDTLTTEQQARLSAIVAKNAELQLALEQLQAIQQSHLAKRQQVPGEITAVTNLFPTIFSLLNTVLDLVTKVPAVKGVTGVVPDPTPVLTGALGSLGGLQPLTAPLAPVVNPVVDPLASKIPDPNALLAAALGSLGGLAPLPPVGAATGVPLPPAVLTGALQPLAPALAPLASPAGPVVTGLPNSATLLTGALGSVGGLAPLAPVVSPLANGLPDPNALLAGALGSLGGLAPLAPVVSSVVSGLPAVASGALGSLGGLGARSPTLRARQQLGTLGGLGGLGSLSGLGSVVTPVKSAVSSIPVVSSVPLVNTLIKPATGLLSGNNPTGSLTGLLANNPVGQLTGVISGDAAVTAGLGTGLSGTGVTDPTGGAAVGAGVTGLDATAAGAGNAAAGLPADVLGTVSNVLADPPVIVNTGALSNNPLSGSTNVLGGNSATGLAGSLVPVTSSIHNTVAPVLGILEPEVGDVAPVVNNLVTPVAGAIKLVTDPLAPVVDLAKPAVGILTPALNVAAPVVSAIKPLVSPLTPAFSALAPVISPISPLLGAANPLLAGVSLIPIASTSVSSASSSASTPQSPILGSLLPLPPAASPITNLLSPVLSVLPAVVPPVVGGIAPVTNAVQPVVEAVKPVTGVVNSVLPSAVLTQVQQVLNVLRNLLGLKVLPLSKRDASAPLEKRQVFTQTATVQNFIRKWHTVGAALTDVNLGIVDELMQVFLDPSSLPIPATTLRKYPKQLRDFILAYFTFAQYLNDNDVPISDRIDIMRAMFDGSNMSLNGKRSMRNGRRQNGIAEDGHPDTGPLLDDAEKFGPEYLADLLGPAGTLDPMHLLHPENRKHYSENGANAETSVDQDTSDPVSGDSSDSEDVDKFVEDTWGGEVPIDAHADEYADAGTIY